MAGARTGLTRYFGADEIAEKCEGIVECWANILGTRGLEANGGIEATCFAVDVRCYEIICTTLNLFIWTKAHNTNCKEIHQVFLFLNRGQRVAVGREPVTRFAANIVKFQDICDMMVTYGKQSGSIPLQCSYRGYCWKHRWKGRSSLSKV